MSLGSALDTYQTRMRDIQDVAETVAVVNHQFNKLLQKLAWNKSRLKTNKTAAKACPVDKEHFVMDDNVEKHTHKCLLKRLGICASNFEDSPSSSFGYTKSSLVVPVMLSEENYKKAGVDFERLGITSISNSVGGVSESTESKTLLLEDDKQINNYIPTNPLDELRFIYSWSRIPQRYIHIDSNQVDYQELEKWIKEQAEKRWQSELFYCNVIKSHFQSVGDPNQLYKCLNPFMGEGAREFILSLWKFIVAKSICRKQNISEHTRNEFDVYGLSVPLEVQNSCRTKDELYNFEVFSRLPMEWVHYNLNREQKLKIYEYVCQTSKDVRPTALEFTELQADAENQMKVLTSLESSNGQKTRQEIMAEMRDYKRRRQSYRGKNKSNAKLTAVEVLREIVEQQMLYLDIINDGSQEGVKEENKDAQQNVNKEKDHVGRNDRDQHGNHSTSRSRRERKRSSDRSRDCYRNRSRSSETRRGHSRSYERKYRKQRRSRSREKYDKTGKSRYSPSKRRYSQESPRERNKKDNYCKFRDRSPHSYKDEHAGTHKEISNVTYYGDS